MQTVIGKIYALGEMQSGTSSRSGEPWAAREVILQLYNGEQETMEKVAFRLSGGSYEDVNQWKMDEMVQVTLRFYASRYDRNGKWYNNINASTSEIRLLTNA